nr:cell wall-binding repeat-containing protein [uncultured Peptostreptococcus sp.]
MKIKQTKSIGIALAMAVVVGGITPGVYADTTTNKTEVERIGGADRTETSLKVLEKLGGVKKTYLVNGYQFSDALSIAPVAAANNEGIVLATKGSVDASLSKQGISEVTLVGGENSISSSVEKSLASKFKTKRIAGTDRYKTSEMIVESTGKKEVGVATGKDFPDALSSGAFLAKKNLPLLLVNGKTQTSLPQGLKGLYTFGGKSSVANDFGKRIAGANRYETSEKIAEEFGKSDVVVLASGTNFADALAAAPLAKKMNAPIVLVKKDSLSENAKKLVKEAKKVYVIGGENTISNKLVDEIKGKDSGNNTASSGSGSSSGGGSSAPSVNKVEVKEIKVLGEGVNGADGAYNVSMDAGKSLKLTTEVIDTKLQKLAGKDAEVEIAKIGDFPMGVEVKKADDGSITIEADKDLSKDATVKVELKSTKSPNVKAEITVTIKKVEAPKPKKDPQAKLEYSGGLYSTDSDWTNAVKTGKAIVKVTNASGQTTTLTHNPKGYEYGKNNIYYIITSFNQNFGCVVEGVAKGDIFTIEVEGYKTVKVISKSAYKSPTFENLTILD